MNAQRYLLNEDSSSTFTERYNILQ